LLEAVHTAVIVLLISWTAFILDVNRKPKKTVQSDRQQAGTLPTLPVSCLQQENRLSLIFSDLPTNCLAYLHICYSLNSSQCECRFFV